MLKYRVEIVPSKYKVAIELLFWGVLGVSFFHWQENVFPYQQMMQILCGFLLIKVAYTSLKKTSKIQTIVVAVNQQGEWTYLRQPDHSHWQITAKSRVSSLLLWVNLNSMVNPEKSQWIIIFKDQTSEQDYRRLSRVVLFQQHIVS